MPIYHYFAVDSTGRECSGALDALTEKEVRYALRMQGLVITRLRQMKRNPRERFTKQELLTFTLQLRQLLEAGLPLYDSLVTMEEQFEDKKWHRLLLHLSEEIQRGASFSEALALHPKLFDKTYLAMVSAGELSGALSSVLAEISSYLEKQIKLQKQIVSALIYPSILCGFASIVIMLLFFFVIPSIEELFESRKLEGLTYLVLQASHFVRDYGKSCLVALLLCFGVVYWKRSKIKQSKYIYIFILKISILKRLLVRVCLARFFRALATLQRGGVNLLEALKMSKDVMNFPPLEEIVSSAEEKILQGSKLSVEFKNSRLLPPLVSRMLAIGEECGSSSDTYQKLAEIYEEEVEKSVSRYTALLQPLILLFMGVVVGVVMLAVLLPLTDTSLLIGG